MVICMTSCRLPYLHHFLHFVFNLTLSAVADTDLCALTVLIIAYCMLFAETASAELGAANLNISRAACKNVMRILAEV